MTVTSNVDKKGSESKETGFVGPVTRLSRYLNKVLMPVVTSKESIAMVANFQRMCGLQADGKVTNRFLNIYFRIASTAGEEIFSLMPLVFWMALPVAASFLTNFLILQIAGQLTKDFFRLPRPISPPGSKNPIIKLDNHFDTEYGLPSTHTIAGMLPLTTLLILLRHGVHISVLAWIASLIYWVSVALSRLYLGVHSVYDVIAGAILGTGLVAILHMFGDALDIVLYQFSGALQVQVALLIVYLVGYPRAGPWSASFGTAAQMVGPFFGCGISMWYLFNVNFELRDTLLQASMVNARPHLLHAVTELTTTAASSQPNSVLSLTTVLATHGRALFMHGADEWLQLNQHLASLFAATGTETVATAAYTWYNTHPDSFNMMPGRMIAYKLLVAAVIAGLAKLILKIVPSIIFGGLSKLRVIRPKKIHEKDCFDRAVPENKAYVVEIPVRLINYAGLGVAVTLLTPYVWNRLPPLETLLQ